jgi:hypothetical protein
MRRILLVTKCVLRLLVSARFVFRAIDALVPWNALGVAGDIVVFVRHRRTPAKRRIAAGSLFQKPVASMPDTRLNHRRIGAHERYSPRIVGLRRLQAVDTEDRVCLCSCTSHREFDEESHRHFLDNRHR